MKKKHLFAAASILLSLQSNAESKKEDYYTGLPHSKEVTASTLHDQCRSKEKKEACIAYLDGFYTGARAVDDAFDFNTQKRLMCIPKEVRNTQLIELAIKRLQDHPEERHLPAYDFLLYSAAVKFPCEKK